MSPTVTIIAENGPLPLMLAVSFDTIVFLVIVVVSLLARIFGKKDPEHAEEWVEGENWEKQPDVRQAAPRGQLDWEEQMRRLLQGEPLDQPKPAPAVEILPAPMRATPVAAPIPPPIPPLDAFAGYSSSGGSSVGKMTPAAPAPGSLRNPASHSQPATVEHHLRSAAAKSAIKVLRNPKTARQAIITSIVLGPAKGLN